MNEADESAKDQTNEDALGWTLRFIRAAERADLAGMERAARNYPHIDALVDHGNPLLREQGGLARLREWAVELARDRVLDELRKNNESEGGSDDHLKKQRREQIGIRLRRLRPGGTTTLSALSAPDGSVVTDPEQMAELLKQHWEEVFKAKPVNAALLQAWIGEDLPQEALGSLPPER